MTQRTRDYGSILYIMLQLRDCMTGRTLFDPWSAGMYGIFEDHLDGAERQTMVFDYGCRCSSIKCGLPHAAACEAVG